MTSGDGAGVERIGRCRVVGLDHLPDDVDGGDLGAVVVIDVIRAFTTAVAVLEAGASAIWCVAGLDEARRLAAMIPGALLIGEERGLAPDGFDAGNSPLEVAHHDWADRTVVQRTSNGTRGLDRFAAAPVVLAASAANVAATASWIRQHIAGGVVLVGTGSTSEDGACARHLAALIEGRSPDPARLTTDISHAADEHRAVWSRRRDRAELASFLADIEVCARVDTSRLVLVGQSIDAAVVLRPVQT